MEQVWYVITKSNEHGGMESHIESIMECSASPISDSMIFDNPAAALERAETLAGRHAGRSTMPRWARNAIFNAHDPEYCELLKVCFLRRDK